MSKKMWTYVRWAIFVGILGAIWYYWGYIVAKVESLLGSSGSSSSSSSQSGSVGNSIANDAGSVVSDALDGI